MPIDFSILENQWRWRPSASGTGCRTKYFPEAPGATFRYGEPVRLVIEAVQDIAPLPSVNDSHTELSPDTIMLGWALTNATGNQGTPIPVLLAKDVEVLLPSIDNGQYEEGQITKLLRYRRDLLRVFVAMAPLDFAGPEILAIVEPYSPNLSMSNDPEAPAIRYFWVRVRDAFTVQGQ